MMRVHAVTKALLHGASGVLFPQACVACEAPLPERTSGDFCLACWAELPRVCGPACGRCGAPVTEFHYRPRCPHCEKHAVNFDRAFAAGVYDGLLRRLVLESKRPQGEGAAAAMGRLAAEHAAPLLANDAPADVIACVPMHWRRRLVRRHNPAESMGYEIARKLCVPFAPRLLRWTRMVRKQSELAVTPRRANVRRALAVRPGHVLRGATVLLVDDILTTGATCSEAARVLKQHGATRVVAVVAARSL